MKTEADFIPSGGVTSPGGFLAGAVHAGIKYPDPKRLDLAILFSKEPCTAAAVFTTNKVKAASVLLDMERLKKGKISVQSPVGKALIGHKVGDVVTITTPAKTVEYEIQEIEIAVE